MTFDTATALAPLAAPFAALGAALTWGVGSLYFARALARPADHAGGPPPSPAAANLFKNLLALALFVVWAFVQESELPRPLAWPTLLASGVLGFALGDAFYLAALPRIGVQKSAMLCELNVPFTAVLSFFLLGKRLEPLLLLAMAVVVAGVLLVVTEAPPGAVGDAVAGRARRAGIVLAVGAALFQSLALVVGHAGMEGVGVVGGAVARLAGGCASAFLLAPLLAGVRSTRPWAEVARLVRPMTTRAGWRLLLPAALLSSVLGLPLFHFALRELNPGIAMVLLATTPLFTLPISRLFGERHGARAWAGTWIGFLGVAWVVWILQRAGGAATGGG